MERRLIKSLTDWFNYNNLRSINNTIMKKLIIALIFLKSLSNIAQQETQYSMYFFNPLLVNSGYAGSQEALNVTALVRSQWSKIDGAPQSQCLTIHSPLKNEHFGVGLTVLNDKIGALKNSGAHLDFAYNIKVSEKNHRLAFGLKLGIDYFQKNYSNLRIQETNDETFIKSFNYSKTLFNTGFGLYYYGERFYVGVSSPRLIKNKIQIQDGNALQENHYYIFGGVVIKLNPLVNMRPSFMIKYVNNSPLSIEGNLSFLIYDKVWLGAMYRYNAFVGANISYVINEKFKIGYAYDYSTNAIQNYGANSHELMLNFSLKTKSKGFKSPRYF